MKYTITHIIEFLKKQYWNFGFTPETDIVEDLTIYGDDFHEMVKEFGRQFSVDTSAYVWYFHTGEEGLSIGSFFFRPPNRRVKRIPVTPQMLLNFANSGRWEIDYPKHTLPNRRWDIAIEMAITIAIGLLLLAGILLSVSRQIIPGT